MRVWETQFICEIVENRFSREMEAECRPECDLPFKNKARREQREGCSWRWVSSRASERERLGCRRMRVSDEEKTLREEIKPGKCEGTGLRLCTFTVGQQRLSYYSGWWPSNGPCT